MVVSPMHLLRPPYFSSVPFSVDDRQTGEQLQAIVSTLISKKIQFAIRGGGHAVAPNASNIDGQGVLVDMRNLTKISYDEKKTSLTIGAGLRWGEVYKFLAPYVLVSCTLF